MTSISRRRLLTAATAATASSLLAVPAVAQGDAFPSRPIRVIVPYAAGGADSYIRPLQDTLSKKHGITLVIESIVGAGGTVGANRVKRAAADGYTLLFCGSGALTIAPKLQNDTLSPADFEPVINLATIPYVIATRKASNIRSGRDFVDYIKRNPGKLDYGSPGIGAAPHLGMEALAASLGTSVNHVPFSGIATAVQSIMGGHIEAVIGAPSAVMPQVRSGQLWPIGVTTRQRVPLMPDLPTLAEAGAPIDVTTHFGFLAPRGTPSAVVQKLAAAIADAARDPAFLSVLEGMQTPVDVKPAAEFARALVAEAAAFEPVIAKLPRQ
ncbi:Bug family tripartite tricarboxylate transporter substrate binding protein [Hydrogenophaga sp. BPS33]|uniref:Bug family tripartite tricarboxylate transporter substrate binding protein n=1 Tax=Hydrogenophaga sp. BPS33 TaxID=2651974 RepID=UPI0013203843|nr:tripartite tricarboxylate transporter substrate binding protein [Hydrogenophaga sp. BPS33]QHE88181.1 tripartite tricarboxylate transporter substrate binding protein [Hydrogenophaga sp. BPS33]